MWTKIVSNRIEILADELISYLKEPPSDPMEPVYVVVQSIGMRRYLEMEISKRLSICANIRFLLPQSFINEIVSLSLRDGESVDTMDVITLTFSLLKEMDNLIREDVFEDVRGYLSYGHSKEKSQSEVITRRKFLFISQVADLYQKYLTYRPEMIRDWESRKDEEDWQAVLWRRYRESSNETHIAELGLRFIEKGISEKRDGVKVPSKIHIFGISSLPPFYLNIISRLSEYTDVNLFIFSPVNDSITPDSGKKSTDINPLFESLGVLSHDFKRLVEDAERKRGFKETKRLFVDPQREALNNNKKPTILEVLQSNILNNEIPEKKYNVSSDDYSVRIHACYNSMRQVEVLRDEILHILEMDKELQPHEIVVMCPEIEQYAPLIDAVFKGDGNKDYGIPAIPYSIADRAVSKENPFVKLITSLFELANGGFKAGDLVELFSLDVVGLKFGINSEDIEKIIRYITDSNIRIGVDKENRKELFGIDSDDIDSDVRTLRFGLDRILMGLSLPEAITLEGGSANGEKRIEYVSYEDVFPSNTGGCVTSESLIKFVDVIGLIMHFKDDLRKEKRFGEWVDFTCEIIREFIPENDIELEEQAQEVYRALREAKEVAKRIGIDKPWDNRAFASFVENCVSIYGGSGGLLKRGITFCRMIPLRNIPFKVVALLGMDDGAFPRKGLELEFDRIAKNRAIGDRNGRDDDLQLFLEAILSARKHFVATYTFVDKRSNKEMPPASPLAQLLDYINSHFSVKGNGESNFVVKRHPLHPFSPDNFSADNPWSYHKIYFEAAKKIIKGDKGNQTRPFTKPVKIEEFPKVLTLSDLEEFFINPQKYFLKHHGFVLPEETLEVKDGEIIQFDNLEEYKVKEKIVNGALYDIEDKKLLHRLIRQGHMPPGIMAESYFSLYKKQLDGFVDEVKKYVSDNPQSIKNEVSIKVDLGKEFKGEIKIRGEVNIYNNRNVIWTPSKLKAKYLIRGWLRNLWLSALKIENFKGTVIIGLDENKHNSICLLPTDGLKELSSLLQLYIRGLQFPLPLFCDTSHEYVREWKKGSKNIKLDKWDNNYSRSSESSKPEVVYLFGHCDTPYEIEVPNKFPDFIEASRAFWEPYFSLLEAKGEEKNDGGEKDENKGRSKNAIKRKK